MEVMLNCYLQTQTVSFMKLRQMMFYEDFYENVSLFDFSDYPKDCRFYGLVNKKWKMKLGER